MRREGNDKRTSNEWLWIFAFPVLLGLALLVGYRIARSGASAILEANDGEIAAVVTDARLPGYRAIVEPTSVDAAILVDGDVLIGAAIVVPVANGVGGTWFVIPSDALVDDELISELYRTQGTDGITSAIETLLALRLDEVAVIGTDEWGGLLNGQPVTVQLADDLIEANGTIRFVAGEQMLDAQEVVDFIGWLNPDEVSANRVSRHTDVMASWLAGLVASSAELPEDIPLSTALNTMVLGTLNTVTIPIVDTSAQGFILDTDVLQDTVHQLAPFALSDGSTPRPQTLVMNGASSDPAFVLQQARVAAIVGAQVTAVGNEDSLLRAESLLVINGEIWEDIGNDIAEALGITEVVLELEAAAAFNIVFYLGSDLAE